MQHGKPRRMLGRRHQPVARESQAGFGGVAEGLVVLRKPGNAGGGKGPWFKATRTAARAWRLGQPCELREVPGTAQRVTCSGMLPCPRAGCGRSARPVR
jgi:hypothetical protein